MLIGGFKRFIYNFYFGSNYNDNFISNYDVNQGFFCPGIFTTIFIIRIIVHHFSLFLYSLYYLLYYCPGVVYFHIKINMKQHHFIQNYDIIDTYIKNTIIRIKYMLN